MAGKNLLALRAELDEQTREIQKLQKEVERATQNTINQLSISYREQCCKPSTANNHKAPRESTRSSLLSSVPLQALLLQTSPSTGQSVDLEESSLPGKCSLMQGTLEGTRCPVDIHSGKTQRRLEQSNHIQGLQQPHAMQSTSGVHLKVQKLMRERIAEVDMRPKSLISQEEGNKLDTKVQELETTNVVQEEMLKQARIYTELLKEKLQKQDQILQDTKKAILIYNEHSNKKVEVNFDLSNLGKIVVQTLQELSDEVSFLKGKIQPAEDQLHLLKGNLKEKEACMKKFQESYDNLVNEHEQERALLVAEMNSVTGHAKSIQTRLESSQVQNAKHVEHIDDLQSKISQLQSDLRNCKKTYKDKVEELKKQLSSISGALEDLQNKHAQCKQDYGGQILQLTEALNTCEKQLSLEKVRNKQLQDREMVNCLTNEKLQRELIERRIEAERLQAMVNMVMEDSQKKEEQQLRTIQVKTASLKCASSQLESIKDALQKTSDELAAKSQCLVHAEKSLVETRTILVEKDKSLQSVLDELKKLRLYAESKKREVQQMKVDNERMTEMQRDAETLKLLLVEKDNMIVTLRGQIEAMTQMIGQQNQKVDALEAEKSQLLDEVTVKKSELQDLLLRAEKKEKRIAMLEELCTRLEIEKSKLANTNTKKILAAKKMKRERDEIMAELRETQRDLANLAEDYETLKREYETQTGDKGNTATILKMQLKAVIAELEQTKNTLNTVDECDGHAVKIATRMQKKITAKREQIDMLQSRVHFLEESLSNATKEKHILKVEKKKLMQECLHEASERQKLSEAAEILKTENNTLKTNVTRTESALEKTMLQLSECQAVIQLLEQETMRLRLQHTLDLQELKGPVSDLRGRSLHLGTAMSLHHSIDLSHPQNKKQTFFCDVMKISEDNVEKPLEDVHLPDSLSPCKDETALKLRKSAYCISDHVSKEPVPLYIAELEDIDSTLSVVDPVKPCYASSPKKPTYKEEAKPKSPVHCLLTAPANDKDISGMFDSPNNDHKLVLGEPISGFVSNTYQNLQNRLECLQTIANDLQMKNKEMSSIFGTADEKSFL
ncbi:coiled-coil domain-containing protein 158 [Bufo gargarizans]|uniref:coiled-coil domain-containing protein 158 n=1 Tax=Bufo gargarizans TaxID=30331 RepID=UPI001CF2D704|nr:coiled-coil domain-containing protein 158 [Bufo gargarizans]